MSVRDDDGMTPDQIKEFIERSTTDLVRQGVPEVEARQHAQRNAMFIDLIRLPEPPAGIRSKRRRSGKSRT